MAHMVSGGGWKTSISITTTVSSPVAVRLLFHGEDGTALTLPLVTVQHNLVEVFNTSTVDAVVTPNSTAFVQTSSTDATVSEGWVEIISSGPVNGFGIFGYTFANGTVSEGTVPIQSQSPTIVDVPYDETAGYTTGIALTNLSSNSQTVTMTLFDSNGSVLVNTPMVLAGSSHKAFMLSNLFPPFIGRGIVQFQSPGGLSAIGLRISPALTFTDLPIIVPE
jgi:hypothetical protein